MQSLAPTHWARGLSPAQCLAVYKAERASRLNTMRGLRNSRHVSGRQARREEAIDCAFMRGLAGLCAAVAS